MYCLLWIRKKVRNIKKELVKVKEQIQIKDQVYIKARTIIKVYVR